MSMTAAERGAAKGGYRCSECGASAARWAGRCRECQAWGTLVEAAGPSRSSAGLRTSLRAGTASAPARRVREIDPLAAAHIPTGIGELDRVLGGGLVPGSIVLLAGEPGVGKSTLLLAVAAASARNGRRALVVTGEESAGQVRLRAERTNCLDDELWLAAETDLSAVLAHLDEVQPDLLIVDSVQTIASPDVDGAAGGVTQVREVASALARIAKERNLTTVLVGHVTKEGSLAGPRVLEHLVDVVLHAEGERHSTLRLVRAVKNRFGAADEIGCFEQDDAGLVEVPDPSGLFLSSRGKPAEGTCATITTEGRRCLPAEIQTLLGSQRQEGSTVQPRRAFSGLDSPRMQMLVAATDRHTTAQLAGGDIFASTVGGMRLDDPAADLAAVLALVGSSLGRAPLPGLVAIGEVALSGEVRRVSALARRLTEAARLGFSVAMVPPDAGPLPAAVTRAVRVVEVADIRQAAALCYPGVRDSPKRRAAAPAPRASEDEPPF